jgi:hypothetical protein
MALSLKPAQGTVVTVAAAGTPVAPGVLVPDNCHTIILYNTSQAATAYAQWVPVAGSFSVAAAVPIPPSASITLAVGPLSQRPAGGTGAGSDQLFLDASGNGTVVNLIYVNGTTL